MRCPGAAVVQRNGAAQWSRTALTAWLAETLADGPPTLVGIDHGLGYPFAALGYGDLGAASGVSGGALGRSATRASRQFAQADSRGPSFGDFGDWQRRFAQGANADELWEIFLQAVRARWRAEQAGVRIRDRLAAEPLPAGAAKLRRRVEQRAGAKSVFHFHVPGSVAMSTHAGLPQVAVLRERLGPRLFVWPFHGWRPNPEQHVLVEAYPALWNGKHARAVPRQCTPEATGAHAESRVARTPDEHDAWVLATEFRAAARSGALTHWLCAPKDAELARIARLEGWILGVSSD